MNILQKKSNIFDSVLEKNPFIQDHLFFPNQNSIFNQPKSNFEINLLSILEFSIFYTSL